MYKALIVDDNEDNLYLLKSLLEKNGFRVTEAHNGAEAYKYALSNSPDIVISDILMPVMDGFSFCKQWKQDRTFRIIPFIFYTATYTDTKDEEFALSLGADAFIIKPVEPVVFMDRINEVLERYRSGTLFSKVDVDVHEEVYLKEYNETLIRKLERKLDQLDEANRSLKAKDEFNRAVLDAAAVSMAITDERGIVTAVNKLWDTQSRQPYTPVFMKAAEKEDFFDILRNNLQDEGTEKGNGILLKGCKNVLNGEINEFEHEVECPCDTGNFYLLMRVTPLGQPPKGLVVACFDVSHMKRIEKDLGTALREKEMLIGELYHRTRNNMQAISSFLGLKAALTGDKLVLDLVKDTELRIKTISLVEQKLYESKDLSRINLKEFLSDLANLLVSAYAPPGGRILIMQNTETVQSLIDIAIPCGLIVTELVANAFKHAFKGAQPGEIVLGLTKYSESDLELTVSDNGKGVPADFDFRKNGSLGLQTVAALAEHQLHGSIEFDTTAGVKVTVRFRNDLYKERI